MDLPAIDQVNFSEKRVIIRCDFDFGAGLSTGLPRVETVIPTIKLVANSAKNLLLVGHRGRPEGKVVSDLTLEPLVDYLSKNLNETIAFVPFDFVGDFLKQSQKPKIALLENIRFWPLEEENSDEFAIKFAEVSDIYVNEAFSVSHRKHASLDALPKTMQAQNKQTLFGFHFLREIEHLSKVSQSPNHPVVFVFGGVKEDKLENMGSILEKADKVLIGGRLPEYIHDASSLRSDPKVIVANLTPDKEDITINSIEAFEGVVATALTIVVAGPLGKYEEESHANGTKRVLTAIANSAAFKIAAGGDTAEALASLGLQEKFNWSSIGGGATLEYLARGTLSGIEAVLPK